MSDRVGRPIENDRLPTAFGALTLLAAAVIVHDRLAGRVVLLQRGPAAKFGRGLWDLPVGKSDPGEPITRTAVRELREETGLIVDPAALQLAQVVHGADGAESSNGFLTVVFAAREWAGELVNAEPAKHAQVRWFDLDELPGPREVVFGTRDTLSAYLAGTPGVLLDGWPD